VSEQPDLPPSFNPGSYRRAAPRDQEKAETRRLTMIVAGIVGLLVIGVLARSFMVARAPNTTVRDVSGTPLITADNTAVKLAPAVAGGMQVPGADQDVLSGGSSGSGAANGQLAPGPETPAPDKLAAEKPVATTAPLPPPVVAQSTATPAGPAPVVVESKPAPVLAERTTRSALAPSGHAPPPPVARGGLSVQLAALGSEADATREWRRLRLKMPAILSGHRPRISTVVSNGHTLYRLRTDGFADRAAARDFCADVREQGGGCAVF